MTLGNFKQAYVYHLQAAEQGQIDSMLVVAWMLAEGKGAKFHEEEALKWYLLVYTDLKGASPSQRCTACEGLGAMWSSKVRLDDPHSHFCPENSLPKYWSDSFTRTANTTALTRS